VRAANAQFTLQPWDHDPHPWYPFTVPANTPFITIVTDWYVPETAPVAIFAVFLGDYSLETLPLLGSKEHTLCGRQTSVASVS